jgi:hypothetical protein
MHWAVESPMLLLVMQVCNFQHISVQATCPESWMLGDALQLLSRLFLMLCHLCLYIGDLVAAPRLDSCGHLCAIPTQTPVKNFIIIIPRIYIMSYSTAAQCVQVTLQLYHQMYRIHYVNLIN